MNKLIVSVLFVLLALPAAQAFERPDTQISGVYEVIVGTEDAQPVIEYFGVYGFRVVAEGMMSAEQAEALYGYKSALKSYRLQNGDVDSHGLLRILEWDTVSGPGVGYAPPETVGQRMAVMRTSDIVRIADVYSDLRENGERWLVAGPVFDDLYDLGEGQVSLTNRRVGVREMASYGTDFVHVFFQRYGYTIPGYGTINPDAPLKTSEFTHHDFVIKGGMADVTFYYEEVLGMVPEQDNGPVVDYDVQKGPRIVFQMKPGTGHHYRGYVSPTNICGKLKFFEATDPELVADRDDQNTVGAKGITLHSFFTPKLDMVHGLASDAGLQPTTIQSNEFGERSFMFTGPDGVSWTILDAPELNNAPTQTFEFKKVDN